MHTRTHTHTHSHTHTHTRAQAYAIGRRYLQAIQTLREAQSRGVRPSQACYGAAINAATRSGKWEVALGLLREMRRGGVAPSVQCYTSAISACGEVR
jgi:pentatricopeptide repeat protein